MAAADQTELEVGELLRQNTAAIIGNRNSSPGAVEIFCAGVRVFEYILWGCVGVGLVSVFLKTEHAQTVPTARA